ncbi:MAG: acyl-CoA dehydrogenase family protein [Rhodospirillaceae bacterium]|jgi:alkylation response protein AidB-like acyl-CoA dehydrogenase
MAYTPIHFTEDDRIFQAQVQRFAEREVAPIADAIDHEDRFPEEVIAKFGDMGLIQWSVPEVYGGPEGSLTKLCIAREELARYSLSLSVMAGENGNGMALPLLFAGTEAQKTKYFPMLAEGKTLVAFALSEPEAGSDAASLRTRAVRDGDDWLISGNKIFVTCGPVADYVLVFARTNDAPRAKGVSAFIVDTSLPGVTRGPKNRKMGYNGATPNCDFFFDNVRVPADAMVGGDGEGFAIAMKCMEFNRPAMSASAVGIAQGALDRAVAFAKDREQFGKPIAEFQGLQFMMADMAMQIESARALLYEVTARYDAGQMDGYGALSAMVKTLCSDAAMKVTTDAVQILGGYGYMQEFSVERMMRDAKVTQIFEGTNQIQRMLVARDLLA